MHISSVNKFIFYHFIKVNRFLYIVRFVIHQTGCCGIKNRYTLSLHHLFFCGMSSTWVRMRLVWLFTSLGCWVVHEYQAFMATPLSRVHISIFTYLLTVHSLFRPVGVSEALVRQKSGGSTDSLEKSEVARMTQSELIAPREVLVSEAVLGQAAVTEQAHTILSTAGGQSKHCASLKVYFLTSLKHHACGE